MTRQSEARMYAWLVICGCCAVLTVVLWKLAFPPRPAASSDLPPAPTYTIERYNDQGFAVETWRDVPYYATYSSGRIEFTTNLERKVVLADRWSVRQYEPEKKP